MSIASLYGRDLLSTEDWSWAELQQVWQLAAEMKRDRFNSKWTSLLKNKKFLMLFCNPSLRTQLSFECAVAELGGHPIYRSSNISNMIWHQAATNPPVVESIQDMAQVMSRYVDGIGIRLTLDAILRNNEGHQTLREYAKWASVPVINLADDQFHPCQALADLLGWVEAHHPQQSHIEQLRGKKLLLTWAKSSFTRPWASVQSHLLLAAQAGMHITLAHPEGYALDPTVMQQARAHCQEQKTTFELLHQPDAGYHQADVVFCRNWITNQAYAGGQFQQMTEAEKALQYTNWMVTAARMRQTNNALFANPMPVDRGNEVENTVVDGSRSVIYQVAENRLHVQKAILALTMGGGL